MKEINKTHSFLEREKEAILTCVVAPCFYLRLITWILYSCYHTLSRWIFVVPNSASSLFLFCSWSHSGATWNGLFILIVLLFSTSIIQYPFWAIINAWSLGIGINSCELYLNFSSHLICYVWSMYSMSCIFPQSWVKSPFTSMMTSHIIGVHSLTLNYVTLTLMMTHILSPHAIIFIKISHVQKKFEVRHATNIPMFKT